jgi:hypothetical protein
MFRLLKKLVTPFAKMLRKPLKVFENPIVLNMVKLFLVLYAGLIAPKLPMVVANLLKNPVVKIAIMFLIIYTGVKDPVLSLLIAIAFTISMMTLSKLETVTNMSELVDAVVDIPQKMMNEVVDGTQGLTSDVAELVGSPITDVVESTNDIVDEIQQGVNNVIDGVQGVVTGVVKSVENVVMPKQEDFSMEDRTMDAEPEPMNMTSLGDLSGVDHDDLKFESL